VARRFAQVLHSRGGRFGKVLLMRHEPRHRVLGTANVEAPLGDNESAYSAYFWLLKHCLTNSIYRDPGLLHHDQDRVHDFDFETRRLGHDWPVQAHTMLGLERLDSLQSYIEVALREGIPGDLIETGVWRGGATILMRAVLKLQDVTDRRVWVADSFEGLPPPDVEHYPVDAGLNLNESSHLAVSLAEVQENFRRYDLLDDQVSFIKGRFRDTLAQAPIERLALMRLDGDLYESTMDALTALYPKLSPGGFVILDDYSLLVQCRSAVDDYRAQFGITAPLTLPDWNSACWRKPF
jgi:hypothetical protein